MSEILKRLSYRKLCEYNLIAQAVVHTKDKKERRRSKNNMRFAHTQIAQNLHFTKWLNFFFFCPDSWENTATKQNKTIRRLPKGLFYVIFVYLFNCSKYLIEIDTGFRCTPLLLQYNLIAGTFRFWFLLLLLFAVTFILFNSFICRQTSIKLE